MATNFDLQPTLNGEHLLLRPLQQSDQELLWEVARDPLLWEQHPDQTRYRREGFLSFFEESLQSKGAFAVIDRHSGRIIGSSRYYELNAQTTEVAIGYTFIERAAWGGAINREMKKLMIDHAAQWVKTIWFHVGTQNWRSRRAMEKIGAQAVGEGERLMRGEMVRFVYYRIEI
jgi:N-acetyltransferase